MSERLYRQEHTTGISRRVTAAVAGALLMATAGCASSSETDVTTRVLEDGNSAAASLVKAPAAISEALGSVSPNRSSTNVAGVTFREYYSSRPVKYTEGRPVWGDGRRHGKITMRTFPGDAGSTVYTVSLVGDGGSPESNPSNPVTLSTNIRSQHEVGIWVDSGLGDSSEYDELSTSSGTIPPFSSTDEALAFTHGQQLAEGVLTMFDIRI